jgi:hypothetical protein
MSGRTPDRENHVCKLSVGLKWLRLGSIDGFVIDDSGDWQVSLERRGFFHELNDLLPGSFYNVEFGGSLNYDAISVRMDVNRHRI